MGSLGHYAAVAHLFVIALIEDAINPHGPHVHIVDLRPTKELVVKVKSSFEVSRVEFVPTDSTGGWRCGAFGRRHCRIGSEDHNRGTLRVRHDGEAEHAGNV